MSIVLGPIDSEIKGIDELNSLQTLYSILKQFQIAKGLIQLKLYKMYSFSGEECYCRDWHGCIMQQSIVGMENIQPYKFSDCSLNDYIDEFRETRNMCLLNKPNEVRLTLKLYIGYVKIKPLRFCIVADLEMKRFVLYDI